MCVGAGEVKIMTVSEKTREKIWSKKRDEGGRWHPVEPFDKQKKSPVEVEKNGHSSLQAIILQTLDKFKSIM